MLYDEILRVQPASSPRRCTLSAMVGQTEYGPRLGHHPQQEEDEVEEEWRIR
jgi:hypothetical protein